MDASDQDMIVRERRDQYLAAMGIQVWEPRGEVADTGLSSGDASGAKAIMAELSDRPASVIPDLTHQPLPPREAAPTITATPELDRPEFDPAGIAEDIAVPTFCLSAIFLPEQVLVVSDVPLDSGAQPLPHRALLQEILATLGFAAPAEPQAACFKWPMFQQVKVDQGEAIAREAVGAYVSAQLVGQQPKLLILLGETAASYLNPVERDSAVAVGHLNCPVIACPGLEAMLVRPGLKARAWKSICEYLGEREQPDSI